jgi:glycosyltransferase involved in cell wall biosynthesis
MKIVDVIYTGTLNSIIGPVQTLKRIINNHDFFLEKGYDVTVFSSDDMATTVAAQIRGSESKVVKKMKQVSHWLMRHSWLYSYYRVRHMFKSSYPILNYYKSLSRKPDILMFHSLFDCYIYLKYYRMEGIKVGCFTHSDGLLFKMYLMSLPRLQGGRVEKKLLQIADYVMSNVDIKPCIAKIEEKNLLEGYPQLKGKTCLVVNAIDDFSDEQKERIVQIKSEASIFKYRLVSLGSVQRRKGQFSIVNAMNNLDDAILKNMHLSIVGTGPDVPVIEDYMEKNSRLKKHVTLLGAVKNTDVYTKLAPANIMVLMSENEGLPISLIEGLRSGLALISTNVSGIPELIDEGVNGFLLEPSVDQLTDLLKKIGEYDWDAMGVKSRKKFEEYYTFTRMRSDYVKMLDKALAQ